MTVKVASEIVMVEVEGVGLVVVVVVVVVVLDVSTSDVVVVVGVVTDTMLVDVKVRVEISNVVTVIGSVIWVSVVSVDDKISVTVLVCTLKEVKVVVTNRKEKKTDVKVENKVRVRVVTNVEMAVLVVEETTTPVVTVVRFVKVRVIRMGLVIVDVDCNLTTMVRVSVSASREVMVRVDGAQIVSLVVWTSVVFTVVVTKQVDVEWKMLEIVTVLGLAIGQHPTQHSFVVVCVCWDCTTRPCTASTHTNIYALTQANDGLCMFAVSNVCVPLQQIL